MEQAHAGEGHDHVVLVAALDDQIVTDGAAGLGDNGDAGLVGPLDVVGEGEEGIGTNGYAGQRRQIGPLLGTGEDLGLLGKVLLPVALTDEILIVLRQVDIDGVIPLRASHSGQEGQIQEGSNN